MKIEAINLDEIINITKELWRDELLYICLHGGISSHPEDYDDIDLLIMLKCPNHFSVLCEKAEVLETQLASTTFFAPATRNRLREHLEMSAVTGYINNEKLSIHIISLDSYLPLLNIGKDYNVFKVKSIFDHNIPFQLKARHGLIETIDFFTTPIIHELKSAVSEYPVNHKDALFEQLSLEKKLILYNDNEANLKDSLYMSFLAKSQSFDLLIRYLYCLNNKYIGNIKYFLSDIENFNIPPNITPSEIYNSPINALKLLNI